MCGIGGAISLLSEPIKNLDGKLRLFNRLLKHRGPDGEGIWKHTNGRVGFSHRRLSIIDLDTGAQPMQDEGGNWITFNGEIYNYIELRNELAPQKFLTASDTEVILYAYRKWGAECVNHLRGMFSIAIWDESKQEMFCARDRFGIKPFYYMVVKDVFYFASEVKALLPLLPQIETNIEGFKDYLTFQFCLDGKTMFKDIHEMPPAHFLRVDSSGKIHTQRYWDVFYDIDLDHTHIYFEDALRSALLESVEYHLRSDVPCGAYVSGGLDSSTIASIAHRRNGNNIIGFSGKFDVNEMYDESRFARAQAKWSGFELHEITITPQDFIDNIQKVIYHLDFPIAGPGSFSQYMVSQLAAQHRKVVLGGQGGDEVFGGYTRYLAAYFEQCIKAAIDGTMNNGNFIVTYESIIPNLTALRNYKPMLQEFWQEGLFEDMDARYFRLINRAANLGDEINWTLMDKYSAFQAFKSVFNRPEIRANSYFDLMTHFDFKTLLPALLQVEDRMSMAHGLEARVPLLDHPLIELAATIPANIKFKNGTMKHIFREVCRPFLPEAIIDRKDKMGFPTPFIEWAKTDVREFVMDVFTSGASRNRNLINNKKVLEAIDSESKFGRKIWGLLSIELWHQEFHDRNSKYKHLLEDLE